MKKAVVGKCGDAECTVANRVAKVVGEGGRKGLRSVGVGLGGIRTRGEDAAPTGSIDGVTKGRPV